MVTTTGTGGAARISTSYITPDMSPRAEWPVYTPPLPSSATPREVRTGATNQFVGAPWTLQQQTQQLPPQSQNHFACNPLHPSLPSRSLPVPSRRQQRREALSARVPPYQPVANYHPSFFAPGPNAELTRPASYSSSLVQPGGPSSSHIPFSPPFHPMEHAPQETELSFSCQHARSYHCGTQAPLSAAVRSCADASDDATPLQRPARHPLWRSVGQAPLSSRSERGAPQSSASSPVVHGASQGDGRGNLSAPPSHAVVLSAAPPTPVDVLQNLFQQYIDAQRALEPMLQQLQVPSHKYLPLALQEAVLAQVQQFAAQLRNHTHPQTTSSPCCAAAIPPSPPSPRQQHMGHTTQSDMAAVSFTGAPEGEAVAMVVHSPRPREVLHRSDDVIWDAILSFLAPPPIGRHATLRAVGPGVRRRMEQHAWSWLLEVVRTTICPFVVENGAEAHVRDAYARLDGRERQYVGSVPVARRTPVPVPRHEIRPEERRLLDGTVLLDCERQSLLLDRAWREGWLHRRTSSHLRYLSPHCTLSCTSSQHLRFLLFNPSRIHIDGVVCDVLRPKRAQHSTTVGGTTADAATSTAEMEDINANTVSRAGLTPPPPPMLDSRPTAALSVTRKLLGDAVSAISRERARSADVSTRAQLSRRFTSPSATSASAAKAAQTLENSLLSASQLEEAPVKEEESRHSGGGSTQQDPQKSSGASSLLPSSQHPYFRHESLPVLMEDVNGTAHVFCTRKTSMESGVLQRLLCGWLQHHHRLRRQPLYTTAAEFLLVGHHRRKNRRSLECYGDVDYVLCTDLPSTVELMALQAKNAKEKLALFETQPVSPREPNEAARAAAQEKTTAASLAGDGSSSDEEGGGGRYHLHQRDQEELGRGRTPGCNVQATSRCSTAVQRLFHARLQEWRAKRDHVVRRMNFVDPEWRMLGNAAGPQPRPLALHLTEQHLPWLATQLCPDSDSGGLADLQELHLCVAESLLPPGWVSAWQWCLSVLRRRKNLLVLSVAAAAMPPPMALGAGSSEDGVRRNSESLLQLPAGQTNVCESVAGPMSPIFMEAVLSAPALQVLNLHGITAEAAMQLFQDGTSSAAVTGKGALSHMGGDSHDDGDDAQRTRLRRLRDLYVTVRRGQGAGVSPRSAYSGEISLSALVFPSLQVLWFDAPRLRRLNVDRFLVLREMHLVSDSALLTSALRGVEVLPHLEVLHLERAVIDDCAFLGDCPNLRELLLHACRLALSLLVASAEGDAAGGHGGETHVEELHGVERASRLETLSMCYTEEIKQLRNFARCRSLRRVLLTRCNGISSSSIAGFELLPQLELLALEYTRVSGLSQFARAPALRVLRVDGCKRVLRSSVMGLEMASHLTELSLQDTNVSTVANFGGGCTALHSLDLSGCRHLDVDGLQGIQALPQLEVLSLSHTPITDVNFLADCLKLTTLYVEGCTELLPTALEDLRSAPLLRKIVANGCTSLTKIGLLGRCRSLEVLSVATAAALTTAGVQGIEHSSHLRFLDLSGTAVHSLRFLTRGCRGLRYLSVRGCQRLISVRELHGIEELPQLETLNMENLAVSGGSLDFLTSSPSLQYVSIRGCVGFTAEDVRGLQHCDISTCIP
jgi:Leucine-rich repeat (LRR) protein